MKLLSGAWAAPFALALVACGGAEESAAVVDPGNAELFIESVEPEPGAVVARNQKVTIRFRYPVSPDTLVVELAGEPQRMVTLDEQEFRFVPFPLHDPDTEYPVRILGGVEDTAGQVLDRDVGWSFHTEPGAVELEAAPGFSAEQLALIEAGTGDDPMDLVTSYDDADSALYDISPTVDLASAELPLLVDRMLTSVVYHGGIGLAAPQIGINRRLFVARVEGAYQAFINPVVLDWGEPLDDMVEGCLSVPEHDVNVSRPTWVEFSYDTAEGDHVERMRLENPPNSSFVFPARVWLHEFDHLNGILLLDRMGDP